MGIYNRLRIVVFYGPAAIRDVDAARAHYDPIFEKFGAKYSGYQTHCQGGQNPGHFYLLTDPSDDDLAILLAMAEKPGPVRISLTREYNGTENVKFSIDSIVADVAHVLNDGLLETVAGDPVCSGMVARCWSGVKVLEKLARAAN